MKKIFVIALGGLFLVSCNSTPERFTVNGTVTGDLENGTPVYLKTTDSLHQLITIDTAAVQDGKFSFKGQQTNPRLHYIFVGANRAGVPFFLENGEISVKFQKDSLNHAKLKGTFQNKLFMKYMDEVRKLQNRYNSMSNDMRVATQQRDTATTSALREEFIEFQEEAKNFEIEFSKDHPNALISALIIGRLLNSRALPVEDIQKIFDSLTPEIKQSEPGKEIKKGLDKSKSTTVGAVAPEFSAPAPNGDVLALSDVKGKLTLIDFWAAWCKPCRVENPNIVSVYNKYHGKGFNVIGVSLDTKAEQWKNAIEADGLPWNHISNLKGFQDSIAELYNVNAIPASFLIDENGVIVAKNLRGPALEEKVAELLN